MLSFHIWSYISYFLLTFHWMKNYNTRSSVGTHRMASIYPHLLFNVFVYLSWLMQFYCNTGTMCIPCILYFFLICIWVVCDDHIVFVPMVYYCPSWIHHDLLMYLGILLLYMKLYLSMGCSWVFVASSFNHLMAYHIRVTQIYPNSISPTWLSVGDESNLLFDDG